MTKEILTVGQLAKIHNKSNSFMRTTMCRPEFGQYRVDNENHYYKFINDKNLHSQIIFFIEQKAKMKGKTCRGI